MTTFTRGPLLNNILTQMYPKIGHWICCCSSFHTLGSMASSDTESISEATHPFIS